MSRIVIVCLVLLAIIPTRMVLAEERTAPADSSPELIGRIYLDSLNDLQAPRVRREIDRFAAQLKEKYTNEIIRIEGSYHLSGDRKHNIDKSLLIARKVESYLRLHHRVQLNLCIATDNGYSAHNEKISIAFFAFHNDYLEKKI